MEDKVPKTNVKVRLVGEDGNAYFIMGRVQKALKRAGHEDLAEAYITEAMSGDYNHLLQTTMDYVDTSGDDEDWDDDQDWESLRIGG